MTSHKVKHCGVPDYTNSVTCSPNAWTPNKTFIISRGWGVNYDIMRMDVKESHLSGGR